MRYFFTILIIGLCLVALLLAVFFKAGKKNKKRRNADLELVRSCGDESLIRLYEQAESENERDGIVEFIKEKLEREEQGLTDPAYDLTPAGTLDGEAELPPAAQEAAPQEPQAQGFTPPAPAAQEPSPRRTVPGLTGVFAGSTGVADSTEQTAYGQPGATHMLALEDIDWDAIENDMQRRREEEARIMAQNQQIQEVFSKIKDVEERLMAEQQDNNHV